MESERTRKIVITGALGAISCLLGITHWGFIPWFGGIAVTIMHIPIIIGAVLEGPIVGILIGLIFGIFSMLQAAIAPTGPTDVWFTNPILAVLPRLFIGPAAWLAWLAWLALKRWQPVGLVIAGIVGSLTNTLLVLGTIGLLGFLPWAAIAPIVLINGLPEAVVSALLTLIIIAAYKQIDYGRKHGSDLD